MVLVIGVEVVSTVIGVVFTSGARVVLSSGEVNMRETSGWVRVVSVPGKKVEVGSLSEGGVGVVSIPNGVEEVSVSGEVCVISISVVVGVMSREKVRITSVSVGAEGVVTAVGGIGVMKISG